MKTLFSILAILVLSALAYYFIGRPWAMHWGASPQETAMTLPGDEIVPQSETVSTRAITIHAPASAVYPWLLQMGQGRGGLYSYDWLENLVGCDIHSLNRIDPSLQQTQIGDDMRLGPWPTLPYYQFTLLEQNRAVVLRSVDPAAGQPSTGMWIYVLQPVDPTTTRLIIRQRDVLKPGAANFFFTRMLMDPIAFVMERKMLYGLRDRAESLFKSQGTFSSIYE